MAGLTLGKQNIGLKKQIDHLQERLTLVMTDRDALLLGCKAFVRWVDGCWGASEILHPETLKEYEAAKIAIKNAEKSQ